ncbi:MAG TPA: HU family DNA-binding protein, partial [Oscillatoriaceae cyanobacterium]
MNKDELVSTVASRTNLSKRSSEELLNALLETIGETLEHDDKVSLVGFGTFQVRERAAREGRNPRTGTAMKIPSKRVP